MVGAGFAVSARAATILIDFGAGGTQTASGVDDPVRFWNNVIDTTGTVAGASTSNFVTTTNASTPVGLTVVSPFAGANMNGTTASSAYPSHATSDSLYGNTEAFSGQSNVTPIVRLTGLTPTQSYDLTFYASRIGTSDNRTTVYTATGASVSAASLNPAENVNGTATISGIQPDASGEIRIALTPGAANNNANHFTYLGVLQVADAPEPGTIGVVGIAAGAASLLRRRRAPR
jgi:hypothetical protein